MTIRMIDIMGDFVMDEGQIVARGRDICAMTVSVPRQDELRNIMIAHIAGLRTATPEELAEVMQVQADMQMAKEAVDLARADAQLLREAMAYEQAMARLAQPAYSGPVTIVDEVGDEVPHPDYVRDQTEINHASAVVDAATDEVVALSVTRANHRAADANTQEV